MSGLPADRGVPANAAARWLPRPFRWLCHYLWGKWLWYRTLRPVIERGNVREIQALAAAIQDEGAAAHDPGLVGFGEWLHRNAENVAMTPN